MEGIVKEFNVLESKMFAAGAQDRITDERFLFQPFRKFVADVPPPRKSLVRLRGVETEGDVGVAYVTTNDRGEVDIHVIMDYSVPERLMVEMGELGIRLYYTFKVEARPNGVGPGTDSFTRIEVSEITTTRADLVQIGSETKVDGRHEVRRLRPTAWKWDF